MKHFRMFSLLLAALMPAFAWAATSASSDASLPIPLDLNASGTYKGLPLTLQDNGKPTVTPVDGANRQ